LQKGFSQHGGEKKGRRREKKGEGNTEFLPVIKSVHVAGERVSMLTKKTQILLKITGWGRPKMTCGNQRDGKKRRAEGVTGGTLSLG